MTVAHSSTIGSANNASATNPAAILPAGLAANHFVVAACIVKPYTVDPTAPTGTGVTAGRWTELVNITTGTTAMGAGTGSIRLKVWAMQAQASDSGVSVVPGGLTGANSTHFRCLVGTKTEAALSFAAASGVDVTAGTGWAVAMDSDPGVQVGDLVYCISGHPVGPGTASSHSLTAPGLTSGAGTAISTPAVTTGNDCGGFFIRFSPTAGPATGAATWSEASTVSEPETAGALVRVRDEAAVTRRSQQTVVRQAVQRSAVR